MGRQGRGLAAKGLAAGPAAHSIWGPLVLWVGTPCALWGAGVPRIHEQLHVQELTPGVWGPEEGGRGVWQGGGTCLRLPGKTQNPGFPIEISCVHSESAWPQGTKPLWSGAPLPTPHPTRASVSSSVNGGHYTSSGAVRGAPSSQHALPDPIPKYQGLRYQTLVPEAHWAGGKKSGSGGELLLGPHLALARSPVGPSRALRGTEQRPQSLPIRCQ